MVLSSRLSIVIMFLFLNRNVTDLHHDSWNTKKCINYYEELDNQWAVDTEDVMNTFKAQMQVLEEEVKGLVPGFVRYFYFHHK